MRSAEAHLGETKVTVDGKDFILCAQIQHLAKAQTAAGVVGINTLLDRVRPTAATGGDYDAAAILAAFEAMAVEGDVKALRTSINPPAIGEMSAGLMAAIVTVFPEPEGEGDTEGNSQSGG